MTNSKVTFEKFRAISGMRKVNGHIWSLKRTSHCYFLRENLTDAKNCKNCNQNFKVHFNFVLLTCLMVNQEWIKSLNKCFINKNFSCYQKYRYLIAYRELIVKHLTNKSRDLTLKIEIVINQSWICLNGDKDKMKTDKKNSWLKKPDWLSGFRDQVQFVISSLLFDLNDFCKISAMWYHAWHAVKSEESMKTQVNLLDLLYRYIFHV